MLMMLVAAALAQTLASSAPGAAPVDDRSGLVFGADVGVGFSSFSNQGVVAPGPTLTAGFHGGYKFLSMFSVGVHVLDAYEVAGHVDALQGDTTAYNLLSVGPEATFSYRDFKLSVTGEFLRVDQFRSDDEGSFSTTFEGRGIVVELAKLWSVGSGKMRAGVSAQFNYAYLGRGFVDVASFTPNQIYHISMIVGSVAGVIVL